MPDAPQAKRRFRVAVSFPGEHRARVENIATALAARLGRDQILYDLAIRARSGHAHRTLTAYFFRGHREHAAVGEGPRGYPLAPTEEL